MSLIDWLHGTALNSESGATRAARATSGRLDVPKHSEDAESVAPVAPVARVRDSVADLTADEERELRRWLDRIEEQDPALIAGTLDRCRADAGVKAFFLQIAESARAADEADRRLGLARCEECANYTRKGQCLAAWRGELAAARNYHPPRPHHWQRCVTYEPGPHDPDRRPGWERWPDLDWQKGRSFGRKGER